MTGSQQSTETREMRRHKFLEEDSLQEWQCDVCGNDDAVEIPEARLYTGGHPIHVCRVCGFVYYRWRRSAQAIADSWSNEIFGPADKGGSKGDEFVDGRMTIYSGQNPYVKARHAFVAEFVSQKIGLERSAVVDIGAGQGEFLELLRREYGADVFGIEPSAANCIRLNSLNIDCHTGIVEDFSSESDRRFDIATIVWTLENCESCYGMLSAAHNVLNVGGHLVVATGSRILVPFKKPLHYYINSEIPQDAHAFYFSHNSLSRLFARCGFKVEFTNRYIDSDYLVMIGRKVDAAVSAERNEDSLARDDHEEVLDFFRRWHADTESHFPSTSGSKRASVKGIVMTEDPEESCTNMDYIARYNRVDVEATLEEELGKKFGNRFREYRQDYMKSLNYDKTDFLPDFPITVGLELVNRCNLTCIMCYTVNHSLPKSSLSKTVVEKIAAEAKAEGLQAMQIGLGSEALLYKNIGDVFAATHDAGVMDIFLASNGVLLTPKICDQIIANGVSRVYVSLDAATPETYQKIRGKPELERIEENIHRLIAVKKERGSRLPIIRVSFCVQKENLHEREQFIEKWKDLVDHIDFQIMSDFSQVDEIAASGKASDPHVYNESALDNPFCPQPFNRLDVWANGDVTPCCTFYAKNLVLGNVKDQSLKDIWHGEKIEALRDEFRNGKVNANCEMCLAGRDVETFNQ